MVSTAEACLAVLLASPLPAARVFHDTITRRQIAETTMPMRLDTHAVLPHPFHMRMFFKTRCFSRHDQRDRFVREADLTMAEGMTKGADLPMMEGTPTNGAIAGQREIFYRADMDAGSFAESGYSERGNHFSGANTGQPDGAVSAPSPSANLVGVRGHFIPESE